jgi:hypothetical protein
MTMKLTNMTIRVLNTRFIRDSHLVILLDYMTITPVQIGN